MATKFAPARAMSPPLRASVFCQKCRSNAWISMVPPDFEATTNSVFLPAISASTAATAAGSVLSRTCSAARMCPPGCRARPRSAPRATASCRPSPAARRRCSRRLNTSAANASSSAQLGPHQRRRAQPAEAALDRALVRRRRRRRTSGRPPRRGRARGPSRASRPRRRSPAAAARAATCRWRPDADSSSAARRPPIASSSVFIEVMNDFTPSSSRPWQTRDRSRPTPRTRPPPRLAPSRSSLMRAAGLP